MDLELGGRVAWVQAASSGLGRAGAQSLAREGASVAISARDPKRLTEVAEQIDKATTGRCIAVPLDVTDLDSIAPAHDDVVRALGPVDILVSNSGGPPPGTFDTVTDEQMEGSISLLVRSAWHLTRAVLPSMRERRTGALLYITSSSTKEVINGLLLSNMMRAAVVGMTKTLSKEVGRDGVRALCVVPGRIDTPRVRSLDEARARLQGATPEEVAAASEEEIPLGRYGSPREFGDLVAFLASDRASYMTGTSVVVDGGLLNGILT